MNRVNIVLQTSQRKMPPWHFDSSCAAYEDDPSLTQQEIDTLARWVSAGAPQGDPRDPHRCDGQPLHRSRDFRGGD